MAPKPEVQFIRACTTGKSEVVRELLQGGLSPETRDTYGLTGLIWAGRKGQVAVARVLLAGGADLEAKDRRGRTALHHALHSSAKTSLSSSLEPVINFATVAAPDLRA